MNTPSAVSTSLGCLLLCAGALSVTPGCADTEPFPDTDDPGVTDGTGPMVLPEGGHVLDEYVLQIRPSQHTSRLIRLKPGASRKPGFKPQSVDNLSIVEDALSGSGPANSIELYTDPNSIISTPGTACPSHVAASFCGTVRLGSFYTRPLNNVFVQATSITDSAGMAITGHSSINSDAPPNWLADNGYGLWKHTADLASTTGVIGTAPDNFGSRVWEFADPDGADTNILLRVVSTLSYKDYSRTVVTAQTFNNTCATNNDNQTNGADVSLVLPFAFTFYNIQATTAATFNRNGVATVGGIAPPSAFDNTTFKSVTLPDNTIPHVSSSPGMYVFWDKLNYNSSQSAICHATTGTAPNRKFVFTWRNMRGFANQSNTMNDNFNVILSEGSDTIDFVYGSIAGATTPVANDVTTFPTSPTTILNTQRAQGKKAIIGVQGPNGSTNISTPTVASFGSTLIPLSASQTNITYRFTPIP